MTQDLLSETPKATIGGHKFHDTFDDDIGSTLAFNRASLKRLAGTSAREGRGLVLERRSDENPLVCVTSKRLRLTPQPASEPIPAD